MRMSRRIVCTNNDGGSIILMDQFAPWLLLNCDGIYETQNNVNTSENTMTDGSTYQGSTTAMRNIVMTLVDRPDSDHRQNRSMLYNIFRPKQTGILQYIEDETARQIEYYVESIKIDSVKRARQATVSLLCPNPFFSDLADTEVQMASWEGLFEWQHEFTDQGEAFGARSDTRMQVIENDSAADHIGLTITIEATGAVRNPTVTHVEQEDSITVGTAGNPFSMQAGDKIIITTHTNNKHAYLVRDGDREEINEYLSEDSEFIQLNNGRNTFGYSADSGVSYMTVSISFRYHYLGV